MCKKSSLNDYGEYIPLRLQVFGSGLANSEYCCSSTIAKKLLSKRVAVC